MRVYGLKAEELSEIKKLFQKHFGDLNDAKVFLFGSRAKGKNKEFSDIDLAVKSKTKDLSKRIALFRESWEQSKIPYKIDLTSWNELFKPYLPEINKTKVPFWTPDEKVVHPWRICPYGKHWVVTHPRYPVGRHIQDVEGHCRRNPTGKDRLDGNEIELISNSIPFKELRSQIKPYTGKYKVSSADSFDSYISGWCKYWNDIFQPDIPIDPNFIKALMESESTFNPKAIASNKRSVGPARGLIQLTEQSLRILKDRKGEIKDHYIDIRKDELFDPSKNICAAIRWIFRKREILQKRLSRPPTWIETVAEYKGLGPDLKKGEKKSIKVMKDFMEYYKKYQ